MTNADLQEIAQTMAESDLITHIMEHEAVGSGRVVNAEKARSTPCTCFEFEGTQYAWSPGVLGIISGKKNPEQFKEFCALGCEPASPRAKKRFGQIKSAIAEAQEEWEERGGTKTIEELKEKAYEQYKWHRDGALIIHPPANIRQARYALLRRMSATRGQARRIADFRPTKFKQTVELLEKKAKREAAPITPLASWWSVVGEKMEEKGVEL